MNSRVLFDLETDLRSEIMESQLLFEPMTSVDVCGHVFHQPDGYGTVDGKYLLTLAATMGL